MPRPPRRTRAVSSRTAAVASATSKEPELDKTAATAAAVSSETTPASSDSNDGRRRSRRSDVAAQTASAANSDAYGVSDRELKRRASLRQAATTTAARLIAAKSVEETASASISAKPSGQLVAAASRQARGPDASGLDIMDDTFADIDTNFGDNDLGDLDDDLDAFDGLDGLDSSPTAAVAAATGSANVTHTTDSTSSSFNVGLFRRGRPRQSSIHSRDDAPIRPSSRGTATPNISSTLNLGTFKRRAREPSILGRRRDTSRHTSRDRDNETSGSEMDTAPYTSDAESSSMATKMRRGGRASRNSLASRVSRVSQASHVAQAAQSAHDSSVSSTSNTTSMLLMARTRTRAATSKKRKSEEGQREDELPKRRATEAATASLPRSDSGVLQSVEASSSSPLSSPRRPSSLPMSDADRRRYTTPGGPDDEIMAPPLSSGSSSASPPMWPSLKALANAGRRGKAATSAATIVPPTAALSRQTPDLVNDDDASDISSPPSLTHSPNYRPAASKAKGKAGTRSAPPKDNIPPPLTSAALAALLPQRHRRGRSNHRGEDASDREDEGDNELERSALLSEDDDELAHGSRRGLRRGRSAARAPVSAPSTASNRQSAAKSATSATSTSKRPVRRTYGSRSFSDKENQDSTLDAADESTFSPLPDDAFEDDTTTQVAPAAPKSRYFGKELEHAAKKFKEVDRWTLEFERVSRSSSPVGAR